MSIDFRSVYLQKIKTGYFYGSIQNPWLYVADLVSCKH